MGKTLSYDEMMEMAQGSSFTRCIDPASSVFLAPDNMIEAIRKELGEPTLPLEDVLSCVYHSLAHSYLRTVEEMEALCEKKIGGIHILGGGSKDRYLNRLVARITGRRVYIGLTEATATGNLLSQWMHDTHHSLDEARECVKQSFSIQEVTP